NPTAGLPGGTTGTPAVAGPVALGLAGAGLGAGAGAVAGPAMLPFLGTAYKWVQANPIKSMLAIQALQQTPAGKYINKIPGLQLLPFLASEGRAGAEAAARGNLGVSEPVVPPKPTYPGAPLPEAPSPALQQSRPLANLPETGAL